MAEQDIIERPDSPSSPWKYFTVNEWLVFALVVLLGLLFRWLHLDYRPLHHDESLHMMYGLYYFDRPDSGFYRYDPMLHGPFLYNFMALVYNTLGVSLFSARVPMAVIGSFFIFVPFFFRKYFSKKGTLFLTTLIALSPSLIYWSRFLRHDFFVLSGMCMMLFGALYVRTQLRALFIMTGLALHFCAKENAYVTVAILCGYFAYQGLFYLFVDVKKKERLKPMVGIVFSHINRNRLQCLLSVIVFAVIYSYFYTGGYRYLGAEGKGWFEQYFGAILDGIYRKSLEYWVKHHNMERIKGPFLFQFYMMAWYDFLLVLAFLAHLFLFYKNANPVIRLIASLFCLPLLLVTAYHFKVPVLQTEFWTSIFGAKDVIDVVGIMVFLIHAPLLTTQHLLRNERGLAFWGYLFGAHLFTYCFVKERVPWLSMYPIIFGAIYLTLYFDAYFREHPIGEHGKLPWSYLLRGVGAVLVLLSFIFIVESGTWERANLLPFILGASCWLLSFLVEPLGMLGSFRVSTLALTLLIVFNARMSYITNFTHAGKASELISQVHTTFEFHDIIMRIKDEIQTRKKGYRLKVLGQGDPVWPLTTYMIWVPEFKYSAPKDKWHEFDYIFSNFTNPAKVEAEGFRTEHIKFRGWWVPNYREMTLRKFLNYAINHTPWNKPGYAYINFSTRMKKVVPKKEEKKVEDKKPEASPTKTNEEASPANTSEADSKPAEGKSDSAK